MHIVSKEIAKALDEALVLMGSIPDVIVHHSEGKSKTWSGKREALMGVSLKDIVIYLTEGYEAEQTLEEKVEAFEKFLYKVADSYSTVSTTELRRKWKECGLDGATSKEDE